MHNLDITSLAKALREKKFSSRELTQHFLDRIAKYDQHLNSFITVNSQQALHLADEADKRLRAGDDSPLLGIPIAHKDIFCTKGIKTSCASKMLDNFISPYDATVVERLHAAGVVTLGKTNMDEFAMGASNENSFYAVCHNPWDVERVPGGSSGGSAAAVTARLAVAASGTDTGGSIRQPAAFCGITGLKPTYGRVSRYGMIAFASSLDQGGPMTMCAADAAIMLQAMAGFDPKDSTCMPHPVPNYQASLNDSLQGLKIGLPKEYFSDELDPKIAILIREAVKEFEKMGAICVEVSLPNTHLAVPAYYIIAPAECSSNLARFDGVRYGYRASDVNDLEDMYRRSRGEGFGREVKRRIIIGTYALSSGYYDAYYLQAQKVRTLISQDFKDVFKQVDVILCPTVPTPAFKIGEKTEDPISMYLSDIYTTSINLAGLPGISFGCGFSEGLPIGMQLIGNHFNEAKILNIAHRYQLVTDWHKQHPQQFI